MPIYEYECGHQHHTERFFKTFGDADMSKDQVMCMVCGLAAKRVVSTPLPAHLYGNPAGYAKPSPSKRHSTKLINAKGNS